MSIDGEASGFFSFPFGEGAIQNEIGSHQAGTGVREEAQRVEAARNGCEKSFRILMETHRDRIFRFCLQSTRDIHDAEEVCQDTFVRAFTSLPRFRQRTRFSAWLFQIARNLCRDRARSRSTRNRNLTDGGEALESRSHVTGIPCPHEMLVRSEEMARVAWALGELPDSLQEALVLSAVEGFSHEECATILGCSVRAVEGRIYRARQQLAVSLRPGNSES